jgi:hypothetical protein
MVACRRRAAGGFEGKIEAELAFVELYEGIAFA